MGSSAFNPAIRTERARFAGVTECSLPSGRDSRLPEGVEVLDATGCTDAGLHRHALASVELAAPRQSGRRARARLLLGQAGPAPHFDLEDSTGLHVSHWPRRCRTASLPCTTGITTCATPGMWMRICRPGDRPGPWCGRFSYGPRDSSAATEIMDFEGLDAARDRWSAERLDQRIHFGVALRGPYRHRRSCRSTNGELSASAGCRSRCTATAACGKTAADPVGSRGSIAGDLLA